MITSLFGEEQAEITTDDYYTPTWLFDQMGIGFDLDVAAPLLNYCHDLSYLSQNIQGESE